MEAVIPSVVDMDAAGGDEASVGCDASCALWGYLTRLSNHHIAGWRCMNGDVVEPWVLRVDKRSLGDDVGGWCANGRC